MSYSGMCNDFLGSKHNTPSFVWKWWPKIPFFLSCTNRHFIGLIVKKCTYLNLNYILFVWTCYASRGWGGGTWEPSDATVIMNVHHVVFITASSIIHFLKQKNWNHFVCWKALCAGTWCPSYVFFLLITTAFYV